MVLETRCLIQLGDILAFQLTCKKCGASILRKPEDFRKRCRECPSCGVLWLEDDTAESGVLRHFAINLGDLSRMIEGRDFSFSIEIKPPHS
jgi:hypothetical protein